MAVPDDALLHAGPTLRIPRAELVFRATPAGGPGGQHVNRVATRVELRWNAAASAAPSDAQRAAILDRLAGRIDGDGWLRVVAADTRSQLRNREAAEKRLATMVAAALRPRKARRRTGVPATEKRRRLEAKRRRGATKRMRDRIRDEE
ncbi:MAG: alternative ribosome rescue aminoacyl-tRNA hydrolase ArfB [Gemmatimonadales bacterium]